MQHTLSVSENVRYGWKTFTSRPGFMLRAGIVIFLVQAFLSIPDVAPEEQTFVIALITGLLSFAAFLLTFLVDLGSTNLMLRVHDAVDDATLGDLWRPEAYWRYLGTMLLVGVSVLIGLILLIAPGVIIALAFSFASFLTIEKHMSPLAALKESARLTKGYRWHLFLLFLALVLINLLGALALLVGLFVTIPLTTLAWIHAYRTIESKKREETASESAPAQ